MNTAKKTVTLFALAILSCQAITVLCSDENSHAQRPWALSIDSPFASQKQPAFVVKVGDDQYLAAGHRYALDTFFDFPDAEQRLEELQRLHPSFKYFVMFHKTPNLMKVEGTVAQIKRALANAKRPMAFCTPGQGNALGGCITRRGNHYYAVGGPDSLIRLVQSRYYYEPDEENASGNCDGDQRLAQAPDEHVGDTLLELRDLNMQPEIPFKPNEDPEKIEIVGTLEEVVLAISQLKT